MLKFIVPAVALAAALTAGSAFAQGAQPQGGMMQTMPMQQGGMAMGCPMMQRMAAMDNRLRQLEERAGIPTPPTQPNPPGAAR